MRYTFELQGSMVTSFGVVLVMSWVGVGCSGDRREALPDGGSDVSPEVDTSLSPDGDTSVSPEVDTSLSPDGDTDGELVIARCDAANERFVDEGGRTTRCVFVAEGGDDVDGDGSAAAPLGSIAAGVALALARSAEEPQAVVVSRGTYRERLVVAGGVSVQGGFDAANGWAWAATHETLVLNETAHEGRVEGLLADRIGAPTIIANLTIRAEPGPGTEPGTDVYGARVTGSGLAAADSGGLILRDLVVVAGDGTAGRDGEDPEPGDPGAAGEPGEPGSTSSGAWRPGGPGGVAVCAGEVVEATRGGDGGRGGGDGAVGCATFEQSATAGHGPAGLPSCTGGQVGLPCGCFNEGADGGPGLLCVEGVAAAGAAALAGLERGGVVSGVWLGRAGDDGAPGAHGVGGSGGGGGGSGCNSAGWGPTGGGGGGGGSGGCGGGAGRGGGPGGSSLALFVVDARVAVAGSTFTSGGGGAGGAGGAGGVGGAGGEGGEGAAGGFKGGLGGAGQPGGGGGAGAGGPGGSSVGVLACRAELQGLTLESVASGEAGPGGAAPSPSGVGPDGVATAFSDLCEL